MCVQAYVIENASHQLILTLRITHEKARTHFTPYLSGFVSHALCYMSFQVLGLGTALKLLMSDRTPDDVIADLQRNEIVV